MRENISFLLQTGTIPFNEENRLAGIKIVGSLHDCFAVILLLIALIKSRYLKLCNISEAPVCVIFAACE